MCYLFAPCSRPILVFFLVTWLKFYGCSIHMLLSLYLDHLQQHILNNEQRTRCAVLVKYYSFILLPHESKLKFEGQFLLLVFSALCPVDVKDCVSASTWVSKLSPFSDRSHHHSYLNCIIHSLNQDHFHCLHQKICHLKCGGQCSLLIVSKKQCKNNESSVQNDLV